MSPSTFQRTLACVLLLCSTAEGFVAMPTQRQQQSSSKLMMYVPRTSSTPQSPEEDGLKFTPKNGENTHRQYTTELSNSVLHEADTLPSFPTAHGILSPETVMRVQELVELEGGCSSEAVGRFLKQYRRHGPMSCLSMLSDPEVLPHLTKAMRDVV